jgi:hypothetical protein
MTDDAGQWTREQVRIDDGTDDPLPPASSDTADVSDADVTEAGERFDATADRRSPEAPWNKGQMAIDDGGEAQPLIDPDAMPGSEAGPTGRRAGAGGGKQFGDVDDTEER